MVSERRGQKLRVWKFYWVGGWFTSNDYLAKAWTALLRLAGKGDDSAVIILYTAETQPGQADQVIASFVKDSIGRIEASLQKTRER